MLSKAPWTRDEVAALNRWQECGYVHPFTCPHHDTDAEVQLVATEKGWRCSKFDCHYEQDWCHDYMLQGPPELPADFARIQQVQTLQKEKDAAYEERNRLVAFAAAIGIAAGWPVCQCKTKIPGWDPEWENCVYIETKFGQMSWHFHDRDAHLFKDVPVVESHEWDGHDTPTKYRRLEDLCHDIKDFGGLVPGEKEGVEGGNDQEGSSADT